jgi:hypothetical protein
VERNSTPSSCSVSTLRTMSSDCKAMCCTPGPPKNSRYSSIWLLRFPSAGSLIGNLIFPCPSAITFDISAEYSVWICSSAKWMMFVKPIVRS